MFIIKAIDNYIYYTQEHFMRSIGYSNIQLLNLTKQEILDNAIAVHQNRIADTISNLNLSENQSAQIEDLLTNDWVSSFNHSSNIPEGQWGFAIGNGNVQSSINQLLSLISKDSVSISNFTKQLSNLINNVEQQYEPILKDYTNAVIQKFTNNSRVGSKNSLNVGSVSGRILETLRSQYSGSAFKLSSYSNISSERLNASLGKLASLKKQLSTTGGRKYLSSLGTEGRQEFWNDVIPQVKNWLIDFNNLVAEIGMVESLKEGTQKTKQEFEKSHTALQSLQGTYGKTGQSGIYTQIKFRQDAQLYKDFDNVIINTKGNGSPKAIFKNSSSSKADATIQVGDNSVTGSIGFSTKNYKSVGNLDGVEKVEIKLQSNSTMLTLLLREANYSYQDLITLINIAAATTDSPKLDGTKNITYDSYLQGEWDKLKDQLLYRSFYAALAGLGGQYDRVFFLGLNGKVISISSILSNIKQNINRQPIFANISGSGFNRPTYQSINKRNFDIGPRSKVFGEYRAERVRADSMRLMQQTKINISMRLNDLQTLIN